MRAEPNQAESPAGPVSFGVLRSVAGERLAQCRDVLHELARQVQRSRHVRIGIEASVDVRMKRQSAALMDFVIERQRAEDPDDAKERARERRRSLGERSVTMPRKSGMT